MNAADVKNALPSLLEVAAAIYPDKYVSDDFEISLSRTIYNFMHDANRSDVPYDANAPLIEWTARKMLYDAYEDEIINPNLEGLSTQGGVKSVSVKSTSVSYGESDVDTVKATRRQMLGNLKTELDVKWDELITTHRKMRW